MEPETESRSSILVAALLGGVLVVGGGLAYRWFAKPDPEAPAPATSASADAPPSRCTAVTADGYPVGELPAPKDAGDTSSGGAAPDDPAENLAPYAAILGRAVSTQSGFAVGAMQEGEGGSILSVVTVDDAGAGSIVRLGRSRGDLEPPVVAPSSDGVLTAMLEPNASGIAMKIARVSNGKVEWGAELDQGKDESLASDIAASGERGVVVWDDVKDDRSRIMLSTFKTASIASATPPRAVSPEKVDASSPRLVPRAGGYFLVYVARGEEIIRSDQDYPRDRPKKKGEDDIDESRGERLFTTWIEAVLLDETGAPSGAANRLSPEAGHVTGFDVTASSDGFILAWRDEDSPSGGSGGQVRMVHVTMGGSSQPATLADEGEGEPGAAHAAPSGAPTLLGDGWVSIPQLRGGALFGRVGSDGVASGKFSVEPTFGLGEPIAARTDKILVVEPKGRAVVLHVLGCVRE